MTTRPRPIMVKNMPNGITATLTIDTEPPHPREEDCISTITTWNHSIVASENPHQPASPRHFLARMAEEAAVQKFIRPAPGSETGYNELYHFVQQHHSGLLRELHAYHHSGILLSTARFEPPQDSSQLGFIAVTPETIKHHRLNQQLAERAIEAELRHLQDYINDAVYSLSITRGGETIDTIRGIYVSPKNPAPATVWVPMPFPSVKELDIWLTCMDLPTENLDTVQAVPWEDLQYC